MSGIYTIDEHKYCEDCIDNNKTANELRKEGYPTIYVGSDLESDYPLHCYGCHKLFDHELTPQGLRGVCHKFKEFLLYGNGAEEVITEWAKRWESVWIDALRSAVRHEIYNEHPRLADELLSWIHH